MDRTRWGQQWCRSDVGPLWWIDTLPLAGKDRKTGIHFESQLSYKHISITLSPTFGWLAPVIRGEQDLDLMHSLPLLPLRWCTSLVLSLAVWLIRLLTCCWPNSLLKSSILWNWFWSRLKLHVNSTENSSPEGDSINAARPSSDLMMISPPGPLSAQQEDHSGHCTAKSMLKNGCKKKCKKAKRYNFSIQLRDVISLALNTFLWQAGMSSSGRYGRLAYLFRNVKAAINISCKKRNHNYQDLRFLLLSFRH